MQHNVTKIKMQMSAGIILNDSFRLMTDTLDKIKAKNTLVALMAADVNPGKKVANVSIWV